MSEKSDARAVPVNLTMRRPTLFGVPVMPILAAPLLVRRAHVEEAGALAALLGQAFEAETKARIRPLPWYMACRCVTLLTHGNAHYRALGGLAPRFTCQRWGCRVP
jgi:hypothetical protein